MKSIFALGLLGLMVPVFAQASHIEQCEFKAEVLGVERAATLNQSTVNPAKNGTTPFVHVLKLKIVSATKVPGSYVECKRFLESEKTLVLSESDARSQRFEAGASIEIFYRYVNSFGPQGVQETESWMLR